MTIGDKKIVATKFPIRGKIFDGETNVEIESYFINSMIDNIFIDENGNQFCIDDFISLTLYVDSFKEFYENIYKQGYKDGQKTILKEKYKISN